MGSTNGESTDATAAAAELNEAAVAEKMVEEVQPVPCAEGKMCPQCMSDGSTGILAEDSK